MPSYLPWLLRLKHQISSATILAITKRNAQLSKPWLGLLGFRVYHEHTQYPDRQWGRVPQMIPPAPKGVEEAVREDPSNLIREDGIKICTNLWIDSFREPNKVVSSVGGYLQRFELWILAYQKVCAEDSGVLPRRMDITRETLADLLNLRNAVLQNRFKWDQRLDLFIRSPRDRSSDEHLTNNKIRRKLTTPQPTPFQDKVVHEVLLMILEPIFEARFSQKSFAFRPGRNAHTPIRYIRTNFAGYLWYLKGDLSCIMEGIRTGIVLNAVVRDVRDRNVVDLIKSALTTPVITKDPYARPDLKKKKSKRKRILPQGEPKPDPFWLATFFGFAPEEAEGDPSWGHCGVLSPVLANVVLDEFDKWMEEKIKEYYQPSGTDALDPELENFNNSWPEFLPSSGPDKTKKIDYIRYGGHFLIGIRGPRADAVTLRKQIISFCESKYGLRLDFETLPIEHITKGIMFLDHVICRRVVYPTLRYTAAGGKIVSEKGVGTLLSVTASMSQCCKKFRKQGYVKGDKEPDPQPCFKMFHATQAYSNAQMNKLLFTMSEWYRYADNRKKVVNFCSYIIRSSLAKLYAAKYKLRSRAKVYKIASHNLSRPLKEKKGMTPHYQELLRMGLADSIDGIKFTRMAMIPGTDYKPFPRNWRPDHENVLKEYLKLEDSKTLKEQLESVQENGLMTPQEYMSHLVWNYKKYGTLSKQTEDNKGLSGDSDREAADSSETEAVVGMARLGP